MHKALDTLNWKAYNFKVVHVVTGSYSFRFIIVYTDNFYSCYGMSFVSVLLLEFRTFEWYHQDLWVISIVHVGSAIGFRLDSLLKLTDTRARNNKMTLMHYLCKVDFSYFACQIILLACTQCISVFFVLYFSKNILLLVK